MCDTCHGFGTIPEQACGHSGNCECAPVEVECDNPDCDARDVTERVRLDAADEIDWAEYLVWDEWIPPDEREGAA